MFSFYIAVVMAVCTFSGCAGHVELDRLAIAQAIGVDYENEEYTVSVQYFNMDQSGGTTLVDNSKPNVITVKGRGNTPSAALADASMSCGRSFMFGIAELIVIGKSAADNDLSGLLSFASSHYQSNSRVTVALAEDKAEDILDIKFKEGQTSVEKLEMVLKNAKDLGYSYSPELFYVLNKMSQPTRSIVVPLLTVVEGETDFSDDKKTVEIKGGALITDGRFADTLDINEMSGVQFLVGEATSPTITLKYKENSVTVSLYKTSVRLQPEVIDGKLRLGVDISSDGKYVISDLSDPVEVRNDIGEACAEIIEERIRLALEKTVKTYGADFADIKYSITSSEYYGWLKIAENYREYLKNAEIEVNCEVDIERYGVSRQ